MAGLLEAVPFDFEYISYIQPTYIGLKMQGFSSVMEPFHFDSAPSLVKMPAQAL